LHHHRRLDLCGHAAMINRHLLMAAACVLLLAGVAICVADGISNSNSAHPMGNVALGFDAGISLKTNTPSKYKGPGDIVSGAVEWYGLRAYTKAYAVSLGKAIRVHRDSDDTETDINVSADGSLNIASANAFAGTDATCTGTIASTTLSCTGASGTPHVFSTITGAGLTQPAFIISCGTFTAGTGTCTLNAAQTVPVGETITMSWRLRVKYWYDQSGNGRDAQQPGSTGLMPQLLPTCVNGRPCLDWYNSCCYFAAGIVFVPQPYTWSIVSVRTGNYTSLGMVVRNDNVANQPTLTYWINPNQISLQTGASSIEVNVSDNVWHSFQAIWNTSSSSLNVDGTDNPVTLLNSVWDSGINQQYIGFAICCSAMTARLGEAGLWPSSFSVGARKQMNRNQSSYWGTP
jgi:hypothetical protein